MRKTNEAKKPDNFIMLPTVDFCFKELMQDEKVRKGLIAALLNVNPTEVESTTLFYVFRCLKTINVTEGLLCVIRNQEKNIQI